jgi:Fe2+ or Zn2+ uptake regulation protein
MTRKKPVLTSQELEIMKVVWSAGASTVRGVYEALLDRRKIAYTTVMTMMNILEQKGYLKKTQKGPGASLAHAQLSIWILEAGDRAQSAQHAAQAAADAASPTTSALAAACLRK